MNLKILLISVFLCGNRGFSDYRFVTFVWFVVKFFYRELRASDVRAFLVSLAFFPFCVYTKV